MLGAAPLGLSKLLHGTTITRTLLLGSSQHADGTLGTTLFGDALVMQNRAAPGVAISLENATQLQQSRSATKKAGGSAKQSVGSLPKNLGMKLTAGELAFPGMIILRQRGTKFHPGANVGIGRDHTIFATGVGKVRVDTQPGPRGERRVISVEPLPEALAAASAPSALGGFGEADSALQLRQVEADLVKRRAEVKRAMLQGGTLLEPALYFPLPRTADGRMSWLERTVPKAPSAGPTLATAAKEGASAKPKASAKKASAAAAAS